MDVEGVCGEEMFLCGRRVCVLVCLNWLWKWLVIGGVIDGVMGGGRFAYVVMSWFSIRFASVLAVLIRLFGGILIFRV